jgi:3-methyladenine DNA glycosylase AlkD
MRIHARYHDEVVAALRAIGNPQRGEAIRLDRGSELHYLGIGFPALRARVKQGFSFSGLPEAEVLEIWDALWRSSPCGDVLFAALEYLAPIVRKRVPLALWPTVRHWSDRVDNWCHSDALSGIYSRMLEAQFDDVYPQLQAWNTAPGEWLRRLSLTSLIHYSGKNAVFLRPEQMLPLAENCVADHRKYVELAVGWVLRELGHVHPDEVATFLERHAASMSSRAYARAIERRAPAERAQWLAIRKARSG